MNRLLRNSLQSAALALWAVGPMLAAPAGAADSEAAPPGEFKVPPPPTKDRPPLFMPMEYPMPGAGAAGTYQLRCWQKGRLLFAENNLSEPVVASLPGKIAAFSDKGTPSPDMQGASTYVVEIAESLCLIKRK